MFWLFNKSETNLWQAVLANEVNQVRELLAQNPQLAEVRAPQRLCRREPGLVEQATPMHAAAARGYAQIVKLLLVAGAPAEPLTADGVTPLHEAASCGHTEVAELLLYRQANLEVRDNHDRTPLLRAAMAGHDALVQLLLDKGARTDVLDEEGNTLLHCLAVGGCETSLQRLLEAGADVDVCNKAKQRTPLHLAVVHADHSVYSRIEPDRRSRRAQMERVADLLLDHGADVNAVDSTGNTPLDLFNYLQGDDESDPLVKLLRKHGGRWMHYDHRHSDAPSHTPPPTPAQPSPEATILRGRRANQTLTAAETSHGSAVGSANGSRGIAVPVGKPIPLGSGPVLIGRNPECAVRYRSRTLSRRHAEITREHGAYMIRDSGSHNGVQINGRHLHAPHLLSPGETITLGIYEFEFDGENLIPLREELSEAELRAEMSR